MFPLSSLLVCDPKIRKIRDVYSRFEWDRCKKVNPTVENACSATSLPATLQNRAFTLVELLVVVAIIAILAALIVPVCFSVIGRAKQVKCANNLRQISVGSLLFCQDHDGRIVYNLEEGPSKITWSEALMPYVEQAMKAHGERITEVFACPASRKNVEPGHYAAYGKNMYLNGHSDPAQFEDGGWYGPHTKNMRTFSVPQPSKVLIFGDSYNRELDPNGPLTSYEGVPAKDWIHYRHDGKANLIFLDGHGELRAMTNMPSTDDYWNRLPWYPRAET